MMKNSRRRFHLNTGEEVLDRQGAMSKEVQFKNYGRDGVVENRLKRH